jgi:ADP-heptose:LPS heptosyltransferase
MPQVILVNYSLLGDSLMTTPAIRALRRELGSEYKIVMFVQDAPFQRMLEGNPNIDILEYVTGEEKDKIVKKLSPVLPDMKDCERILYDCDVTGKLWRYSGNDLFCVFDIGKAMQWSGYQTKLSRVKNSMVQIKPHLSQGFANQLDLVIDDIHYDMILDSSNIKAAKDYLSNHSKPVILCGALSSSCTSRYHLYHPESKPLGYANKMIDAKVWNEVIKALKDKYDFVFLCAKDEPRIDVEDAEWLEGWEIKNVAALCAHSSCTLSIDTGISHICAAVDGPMVLMTAAVESSMTAPKSNGPFRLIDYSSQSGKPRLGIGEVTSEEIIENFLSVIS